MEQKQHFIPHTSRSLQCIWFVAVAFRSEEEVFLKKGAPEPFLPRPGSAPGQIWPNIFMHVLGHEHFISAKFCKHPLSVSVVKADYVLPYIYACISAPPPPFSSPNL